jgi:hypothetical protein
MTVLDHIDRATSGLCPCGAKPAPGSAYCSDACRPTDLGRDADTREPGHLATAMRWRPDLVTAIDDSDLIDLGGQTWYGGHLNARIYQRAGCPGTWHLRLDDGHRFVGCDLRDVGGPHRPVTDELISRVRETWRRLERELIDPRRADVGGGNPWRRRCRRCGRHGVPVDGREVIRAPIERETPGSTAEPDSISEAVEPRQLCQHCHTPFPGPALTPMVESHGRHTVLRLTYLRNGEQYTRSAFVTGRNLAAADDPSALLQAAWDRLEAFLLDGTGY